MKTNIFRRIAAALTAVVLTASALPLTTAAEYVTDTLEQPAVSAEEFNSAITSGDYKYNLLDDGTIEIADYTGFASDLSIPSEIDGYKVSSIDSYAFLNCKSITSVIIPDGVNSIKQGAFQDCTGITYVMIPASVTNIGSIVFRGCINLTNINIDDNNLYYKSIDGVLFDINVSKLLCYPAGKVDANYIIPNSVTDIGYDAFMYCVYLTNISLSPNLKSIETFAFGHCNGLTSITIPKNVSFISPYAFYDCTNLLSIFVDVDNPYFKCIDGVLFSKDGTALVRYPAGKKNEYYDIPNHVTTIRASAFQDCVCLTDVKIPKSVTCISEEAFFNCTNLACMELPNSVTSIGQGAFRMCSSLTSIKLPCVAYISSAQFLGCKSLRDITIPSNIIKINDFAFAYCSQLTNVYYTGIEAEWAEIDIGDDNEYLTSATIHYNHVDGATSTNNNTADADNNISTGLPSFAEPSKHTLESAVYTAGSLTKDLLKEHHKITFGDVVALDISTTFTIACSTKGDEDKVSDYSLYCGTKLIKTTDDGLFDLKMSELTAGKDYYVVVTAHDGTYAKTPLMLEVEESPFFEASEIKLGGSDGFEFKFNNEIIGNMTIACDALKLPVEISVSSDGTVRFGVNVKKDVLDDKDKFFDFKKEFEDAKLINQYNKLLGKYKIKSLKSWLTTPVNKVRLVDKDQKCDLTIAGYGETQITNGEVAKANIHIIGTLDYGNNCCKTFVLGFIPVVVDFDFSAKGTLDIQFGLDYEAMEVYGDADLNIEVAIEPFVGVGVDKLLGLGVTGKGELAIDIVLVSTSEPSGVDAVDLTAGIGIKAYLGPFKYEHKIAEKTWNLYSRSSTAAAALEYKSALAPLYNSSSYVELSASEYKSEFLGAAATADTLPAALIEDAYLAAAPKLATNGEDMVLIYLDSDVERGTANQTVLKYMVYKDGTWSEPKQLDSNGTVDWGADIYEINGEIWAIYQDAADTFSDTVTTDELAESFVIKAARFDVEIGSFTEPVAVSGSDGYNHSAAMGLVNGEPAAVWVNNEDTDFFGLNTTNSIMYSLCQQGVWSEPVTYTSGLNTVTGLAIGDVDGEMQIVYMTDGDNDFSTTDDITLYAEGQEASVGAISGLHIGELPSVSGDVIYWHESGTLSYFGGSETETLSEDLGITNRYVVAGSSVLYYGVNAENKGCIYMTSYNGSGWSAPVVIYTSDNEISAFTACEDMAVFMDTLITAGDDELSDSSVMKYFLYSEYTDVAILQTDFNYEDITVGGDLPVTLTVENKGTTPISEIAVRITDSSGTVLDTTVSTVIEMGELAEIVVQMPVEKVDKTEYTVTISADNDQNTSNDSAKLTLGRTELSVTSREVIGGNNAYLVVDIHNESYVPAGCTLLLTDEDGNKLKRVPVANINGKNTHQELFDISELLGAGEETGIITVEITTESEEYYTFNNTIDQYIREIDGDIAYAIISFLDSEGNELTSAVYNIGDEIIAPELPSGSAGWIVYGDETNQKVTEFGNAVSDMIYIAKEQITYPQNIKAEAGDSKVTLSWDAVEDAEKYAVYIYENNKYTCLDTEIIDTSYTVSDLTNGKKYGFKLKAYDGAWSVASPIIYAIPADPSASVIPENIKTTGGNGTVTMSWDAVAGATKYAVYMLENGAFACKSNAVTETSYTFTGLTNGTKYAFRVKAFVNGAWKTASGTVYGTPASTSVSVIPENIKTTGGNGTVTMSWDAVTGATKYAVYMLENGAYVCKSNAVTSTSYTFTGLTNGTKYAFRVKAFVNGAWKTASGTVYGTTL
ncbi:MAG: fibronectin type III domain-containing protein [Oscillospiraceae bacterium]|nr:fibronectin type III domain-containing protein [Oscillospiraceae bacterium]